MKTSIRLIVVIYQFFEYSDTVILLKQIIIIQCPYFQISPQFKDYQTNQLKQSIQVILKSAYVVSFLTSAYYVNESMFQVCHLGDVRNSEGVLLKSTLIRHINFEEQQPEIIDQVHLQSTNNKPSIDPSLFNSKCIIFLHGLGSSRLEALPLVQSLPQDYCLFCFDFAGSGKSQGNNITYGMRQSEDISLIMDYLKTNRDIKQFIIWGRSMGAVATLLFAINLSKKSQQSLLALSQVNRINAIVVDSPFSNFREITKQIAIKKINIPEFVLNFGLNYVEENFDKVLNSEKTDGKNYNPFQIRLGEQSISLKFPALFFYSLNDQVVPKQHSEKIIKSFRSHFDKIVLEDCPHNNPRPKQVVQEMFQRLRQFEKRKGVKRINEMGNNFETLKRNQSFDDGKGERSAKKGISLSVKKQSEQRNKTEATEKIKRQTSNMNSYIGLKVEPKRTQSRTEKNTQLVKSVNKLVKVQFSPAQSKKISKVEQMISITLPRKQRNIFRAASEDLSNLIDFDNEFVNKKLFFQKQMSRKQTLKKLNFRNSQMSKKVESQLHNYRYL